MSCEQGLFLAHQGRVGQLAGAQLGKFELQRDEAREQACNTPSLDADVAGRAVIAGNLAPWLSGSKKRKDQRGAGFLRFNAARFMIDRHAKGRS